MNLKFIYRSLLINKKKILSFLSFLLKKNILNKLFIFNKKAK